MMRGCPLILLGALLVGPVASRAESPGVPPPTVPDPATVQRFGPAYRYPQDGWIIVHIEGQPYERGYQYGRLLAPEIGRYMECIGAGKSSAAPADGWRAQKLATNALFLRRYDPEFLEEMKGIADGAATVGGKVFGQPIELLDVVALNSDIEFDFLEAALQATPTGLEGKPFAEPVYPRARRVPPGRCSAFAATAPATRDGKIVFGHITMWTLRGARWFNVWLDIQPARGQRLALQTYPGGIMSGMDYYQNAAGILLTETTIAQTPFDSTGLSLTSRCRKAMQYGTSIEEVVQHLQQQNNGSYSNEWLIADTKTNEIAMLELGTRQSRLWRSSKNEWPGGTPGFYWGCNNAKELQVRLETLACLDCRPANVLFRPSARDLAWQKLYREHRGQIDAHFARRAFTAAPLAAFPSLDAKFTTTDLAKELRSVGIFGHPTGQTWEPTEAELARFGQHIGPLVSNSWTLLSAAAPPVSTGPRAVDLPDLDPSPIIAAAARADLDDPVEVDDEADGSVLIEREPAWRGTLLPKTDADLWLAAAFADYERIVALERNLRRRHRGQLPPADAARVRLALFAAYAKYHQARRRLGRDLPLAETQADLTSNDWHDLATSKGVLLLASLRQRLGAEKFDRVLDEFGRKHAGQAVTSEQFFAAMTAAHGESLAEFLADHYTGARAAVQDQGSRPIWSLTGFEKDPEQTLIVFGTTRDAPAQREAAQRLQQAFARGFGNHRPALKADVDLTEEDWKHRHLLLIGRPDTNRATQRVAAGLPVQFGPRSFQVAGRTYAAASSAVITVGANPDQPQRCVVVFAGMSAEATWKCVTRLAGTPPCEALVLARGDSLPLVIADWKLP